MQGIRPIEIPRSGPWRLRAERILAAMGLGSFSRARRSVARQLRARTDQSIEAWPARARRNAAHVSGIIAGKMDWPNAFFVPADPLASLLLLPRCELTAVEAVMELEDACAPDHLASASLERMTLGDVVQAMESDDDESRQQ